MRQPGAPRARAASTYSRAVIARTWPRIRRAKVGVYTTPRARTTPPSPAPSTAPRARASTSGGNDSTASISRITSPSRRPPAYPAASPRRPPATSAMATEPSPAASDPRVPQMPRDSTSRPTLSVPSQCSASGRVSAWPRSCRRGSWGETTGASAATANASSVTPRPSGASRAPAARRSTAQRRSAAGRAGAEGASADTPSAIPDPRIDPAIQEVNEQVGQDEAHRDQQHDALDQRVVAREHRVDHEAADAGQREHVLGDHRAADQRAELQPEH